MSRLPKRVLHKIRQVFQDTGSIHATAERLGVSRNAVRRELRGGPKVRERSPRPGKLDPFKAKISYLVNEQGLTAVRVLEEIQALGYEGGYSILKDHVRTLRPRSRRRPTAPIAHRPGQEGQMDWSPHRVLLGGRELLVHTGSIILCFSRWFYVRFGWDETLHSVMGLHEAAFEELGAVPATMTYDNMTTVGRHIGPGEVWMHPRFEAFAQHYGFEPIILPPGAKDRHGMVERPFHDIEHNFLAGREFADLEALNRQADQWRFQRALVRIHGTLKERPVDRLQRERPFLQRLPRFRAQTYREVKRTIQRDFCVAIDTNRYSASPHLVGEPAQVRLYEEFLEIWVNEALHCRHTYALGREQRQVLPEHQTQFEQLTTQSALLEEAFGRLGPGAQVYYEGLKQGRGAAAGYHMQRILKLANRYGSDVVSGAMAHAQRHGAYSAQAIERVIQGKALRREGQRLPSSELAPEHVKQWLRACAIETDAPDRYDRLLDTLSEPDDESD